MIHPIPRFRGVAGPSAPQPPSHPGPVSAGGTGWEGQPPPGCVATKIHICHPSSHPEAAVPEIVFGLLLGVFVGSRYGWPSDATFVLGGLLGVLAYMGSCWWWPYRACPWPWCTKRQQTAGDRRGNYRRRRQCRLCGGSDWVRLGARLIGRG